MPGVNVKLISAPAARFNPSATGKWFCVALLERGSTTVPILVTSMTELKELCGGRVPYSSMWDAAETFFEEGGSELILARVVGKTPVAAKLELEDSTKAIALKVTAKNVGEWGNKLEVAVKKGTGEGYFLIISESGVVVEESPELASQAAAVTWAEASAYVNIAVGAGSKSPAEAAAKALSGGTYDGTEVEEVDWEEALNRLSGDLGPGQVSAPGITTESVGKLLLAHAEAKNRTALLDLTNSGVAATLISAAAHFRSVTGARRGAAYAPWAIIPGLAAEAPRTVPYSAVQAGILARNDQSGTPPPVGVPSAGENGRPRFATGLSHEWKRQEREELNNGSVNVARTTPSGYIETYGNRALVKPEVEPAWEEVSWARLYMFIWAEGEAILEKGTFKPIDPKEKLATTIEGLLAGFLGSLGGVLNKFTVNAGPSVNTTATKTKKEIRAQIEVEPSEIAETATLDIAVTA